MKILALIAVAVIALEHLYILWLEMFAWTTVAPKVFRSVPKDMFEPTKALAANQGLYNGFLSAGLIWSMLISDPVWAKNVACFFLGCVVVAGVFGAVTADKGIFTKQALPAIIALLIVLFV